MSAGCTSYITTGHQKPQSNTLKACHQTQQAGTGRACMSCRDLPCSGECSSMTCEMLKQGAMAGGESVSIGAPCRGQHQG